MSDIYGIIERPVITEKGTILKEEANKVVFWVRKNASKSEIRKAVQKIFKVSVVGVNTVIVPGKKKRMGKGEGKTPVRKKAYVTLKQGDNIELFEGV